ncbi:hypothetical protein [Nocardia sp. SSK8]|uniref:hypothetical protein n=1 Tax=Nocardia sp. SSK8 TaxID=3120154 RepID=UPI00300848A3
MSENGELQFDVARGDLGVSRHLEIAMKSLRQSSSDPVLRGMLDEVLAGRMGFREFGATEVFAKLIDRTPARVLDDILNLSEEEREALVAQGERELEELRNQPSGNFSSPAPAPAPAPAPSEQSKPFSAYAGTRKPNRDAVISPDEPDDDDLYFQDRRNRGWLV